MFLGRNFIACVATLAVAISLTACGGKDSATTTADAAGATSATGGTAGGKSTKTPAQIAKETQAAAKKASKKNAKKAQQKVKAKEKAIAEAQKNAPAQQGSTLSAASTRKVKIAFNQYINALDKRNIEYLCGHSYSKEFLANQTRIGGCDKATEKLLGNAKGYSAKILGVGPVLDTDLAQVYADITQTTNAGQKHTVQTVVYFTDEGGIWKRTVAPEQQ